MSDAIESVILDKNTYSLLSSLVYKIIGKKFEDDVEDVTQNAIFCAWHRRSQFRGDSSVLSWLYTVTKNEALQHIRRSAKYSHVSLCEVGSTQRAASKFWCPEARYRAKDLWERYNATSRVVARGSTHRSNKHIGEVLLSKNQLKQDAERLGVNVPALKSAAHRFRIRLRKNPGIAEYLAG